MNRVVVVLVGHVHRDHAALAFLDRRAGAHGRDGDHARELHFLQLGGDAVRS